MFPAASVAETCTRFIPSFSHVVSLNEPLVLTFIGLPLTNNSIFVESFTVPETTIDWSFVIRLSIGDFRFTIGACVSRITKRETIVLFPAASVAINVMVFIPSVREIFDVNELFTIGIVLPFTVSETEDEPVTVPLTFITKRLVI